MPRYKVTFYPHNKTVAVEGGTTLLDAVAKAHITINNLCGGDGICGRCKMIVVEGKLTGEVSTKLNRVEITRGYVLACMAKVESDLVVDIPEETLAKEKIKSDKDAERFRSFEEIVFRKDYTPSPLTQKIYIELDEPTLANNAADLERLCETISRNHPLVSSMQMSLKIMKILPEILRKNDYRVTTTVGMRRDIAELMNIESGNTSEENYIVIVDMGTTTIVAHLVNAKSRGTLGAKACFNSQGIYGREVTRRMITAEKKSSEDMQRLLVDDINRLIEALADESTVNLKDITAVVCAGNPAMAHFLLGLSTYNMRRYPYIAISVEPPPLRAAEVGIEINPRGLLYSLPGISAWVGSDITAGILATEIYRKDEVSLLVDIGTNGEIVVGNREWLVAASASAGPALEGASVSCGMRAEPGAIERVYRERNRIGFTTIGTLPPKGICGSGIIDLMSVLLEGEYINRSGAFLERSFERIREINGVKSLIVAESDEQGGVTVYISESDIENIITAKAAIFAAMKILLKRLDMDFSDVDRVYISGAFGYYLNIESAVSIGLIPNVSREKIEFVGNTSIRGAKIVALHQEAYNDVLKIRKTTTYYDLMGADDYVEEFQKALFLPHTDIELFEANVESPI